jgi:cytochrome b involved in lipid metabolism
VSRTPDLVIVFVSFTHESINHLYTYAGAECTEAFEDTGHSTSARNMMGKYLVGSLAGAEKSSGKEGNTGATVTKQNIPAEHGGSPLAYVIPILILVGVLYYQFVFLPKAKENQSL